jgi:hypothetical protein
MYEPPSPSPPARIAVITCAVLEAEVRHVAAELPQVVHIEVLEQGLHNEPPKLRRQLQEAVDRVEALQDIQAIVLGYGLCSRGTESVSCRRALLVLPRAHDCITVLLGEKQRYADYVEKCPGTYWYSHGWNRHHLPPGPQRYEKLRQQYIEKFGPEDADFLMEQEQNWFATYQRATYVDLGIGTKPADLEYTRQCAQWLGWSYDYQRGDIGLLRDLLAGRWDEDRFLVLRPGQSLRMTADQRIVEAVDRSGPAQGADGQAMT